MTWHSFFSLQTMQHRHLLFAYIVVWALQGGYFGWTAWQWHRLKNTRP